MLDPKYTITNKLLSNIKKISEIVAILNNQNFSNVVLMSFEKKARETSAYSSTSIEGNPLPLTEVKRILKSKPEYIRDTEKEVLNYNEALKKLNDDLKNHPFDLKLILNIQKTITNGLIAKQHSGKLRKEPVVVNDPATSRIIYMPPNYGEVEEMLKDLLVYIQKNEDIVDSLILAGIFHRQFVIIHPFIDGNGRTARLATKILLAKIGLNTFNLFSFENYYNKNVTKYFKEVGILGDYYEKKDNIDFTSWLEYFTEGIIDELLRVQKELKNETISPKEELKEWHYKILDYIKKKGYIRDKDYSKLVNRAKPTRNLDFRKLIDLKLIEKLGKGKATYYKFKKIKF